MLNVASFSTLRQNGVDMRGAFKAQACAPLRAMRGSVSSATFTRFSGSALLLLAAILPALFSLTPAQREKINTHIEQSHQSQVILIAKTSPHQITNKQVTNKDVITTGAIAATAINNTSNSSSKTVVATPVQTQATSQAARLTSTLSRPQSWVEHVMNDVTITNGHTLQQGDVSIKLAGLELPTPDQMCSLLNGKQEPCINRMATQLELLTRHRHVTCRHRALSKQDMINGVVPEGTCRIGEFDLTTRMVERPTWKMLADQPVRQAVDDAKIGVQRETTPHLRNAPLPPMRPDQIAML